MNKKIVIIGAGHVGSHCASALAMSGLCERIVLLDLEYEKAMAQAQDVADSVSFMHSPVQVTAARDYEECKTADLVVIAIGQPRLPGQTRLDLLADSVIQAREVATHLKEVQYEGIIVTITNPADIIADCMRKAMGLPKNKVFGTGTLLDTARCRRILSELTGVDRRSIECFSMGEHGDSSMIPFSHIYIGGLDFQSYSKASGTPINKELVLERTRGIGMDIINGKGSTEFGIGLAMCTMAQAILRDEKRILPASVLLEGEYGQTGIHCGVPCLIGANGVERIVELELTEEEKEQLNASCQVIRKHIEMADAL